jgi:hypothetical protein
MATCAEQVMVIDAGGCLTETLVPYGHYFASVAIEVGMGREASSIVP